MPIGWVCRGLLLAPLALAACTAPRAVAPAGSDKPAEIRLQAGDTIRLVTRDRARMSVKITEIRAAELAGQTVKPGPHETVPAGRDVVVPYDDLALAEVRESSPLRSAAAPAVIVLVAAGIALQALPVFPAGAPVVPP